jgi:F0F1-type ATP synthase epsilon subunit
MAELEVEIVAADHFVWSGAAKMVKARTSDGEIGILLWTLTAGSSPSTTTAL